MIRAIVAIAFSSITCFFPVNSLFTKTFLKVGNSKMKESPLFQSSTPLSTQDDNVGGLSSIWESNEDIKSSVSPKFTVKDFFESIQSYTNPLLGNHIGNALIDKLHNKGILYIKSASIPQMKNEAWRYTSLRTLFSHPFVNSEIVHEVQAKIKSKQLQIIQDYTSAEVSGETCVLFVDGSFVGIVSPDESFKDQVTVESLAQSDSPLVADWQDELLYSPDVEELPRNSFASDLITALNMANLRDAAVIDVPASSVVANPVHVLFANTAGPLSEGKASASYPKLLVRVGDGAELRLRQSYITLDKQGNRIIDAVEPNLVVSNTRFLVGNNARLSHTYLQELSESTRHLEVLSAVVRGNSSFETVVIQSGALLGRVNAHIDMKEEAGNCTLNGVTLAGRGQSLDMHSSIVHDTPAARSEQNHRNVVGERGEAIFKGRIRIPKKAQLTVSSQLCRSVMLGEKARVVAMPTLEITADNIECSHGASVADLDENSMFYLAARGISRQEARKLLLRGFVFDLLLDSNLDKAANKRIIEKVEQLNPLKEISPDNSGQKFMSI